MKERARSRHLAGLLELRHDARHVTESRDEREAGERLRHPRALHLEALHRPVARRDRVDETVGEDVLADHARRVVQLALRVHLAQRLVRVALEVGAELLEEVLGSVEEVSGKCLGSV